MRENIQEFKKLLIDSLMLKDEFDIELIDSILTEKKLTDIFQKNFSGNLLYAEEKLTNSLDTFAFDFIKDNIANEIKNISGLSKATNLMHKMIASISNETAKAIDNENNSYVENKGSITKIDQKGKKTDLGHGKISSNGKVTLSDGTKIDSEYIYLDSKILVLVDKDADGSTAWSSLLVFMDQLPKNMKDKFIVSYAHPIKGSRAKHGMNKAQCVQMVEDGKFKKEEIGLVITADNAVNLNGEEKDISKFFQAPIIITDHHTPNQEVTKEIKDKVIMFNPKFDPSTDDKLCKKGDYFDTHNVSGAQVFTELLKSVSSMLVQKSDKLVQNTGLINKKELPDLANGLDLLSTFANMSDIVVEADPVLMPQNPTIINKFSQLANLINTDNNIGFLVTKEDLEADLINLFGIKQEKANRLKHALNKINFKAKKLLELAQKDESEFSGPEDFKDAIINIRSLMDVDTSELDNNYISLLRPYIIKEVVLETEPKLSGFYDIYKTELMKLFRNYQQVQKEMVESIREEADKGHSNLIQTKIEAEHSNMRVLKEGIKRKFAGIAENELVTGFKITFDGKDGDNIISGSFRSNVSHRDIFTDEDLENFLNKMNLKITIAGHKFAAGFSVEKTDGTSLEEEDLTFINNFINKKISTLQQKEEPRNIYTINNFFMISKVNELVGGSLPGRESIELNISFDKNDIKQLLSSGTQKYGWKVFKTSLDGAGLIMPTNILKEIEASGKPEDFFITFQPFGKSFIASKLSKVNPQDNHIIKNTSISQDPEMQEYYDNMTPVDNGSARIEELKGDEVKQVHFAQYAENGEHVFKKAEALQIKQINTTKIDSIAVLDVETSNGLGNATINNVGINLVEIDENSGTTMKRNDFLNSKFSTVDNKKVFVSAEDRNNMKIISSEDKKALTQKEKLYIVEDEDGALYYNTDRKIFDIIYTEKELENGDIIFNQSIKATNVASFIFEKDMENNMSWAISHLTHIDRKWLEINGKDAKSVDEALYSVLKDKTFLLQAHNIMFDFPLMAQFPKTYQLFLETAYFYDSANAVRKASNENSSYASTKFIDSSTGNESRIVFNNQKGAENSLDVFIDGIENFAGETEFLNITDVSGMWRLSYDSKNKTIYLINKENKKKNIILEDTQDAELIKEIFQYEDDYSKSEKFGVQHIDTTQLATNILLSDKDLSRDDIDYSNIEYDKIFFSDNFQRMLEKYKFTNEPKVNIMNYVNSIGTEDRKGIDFIKGALSEKIKEDIKEGRIEVKKSDDIISLVEVAYEKYIAFLNDQIKNSFLENNSEINEHYTLVKILTNIIPKLPNLEHINDRQIQILSNQEDISVKTLNYIIEIIKQFEDKWNIKIHDIEELHFNLVAKIIEKAGDTTLESQLLLVYLNRKLADPLNKTDMNLAVYSEMQRQIILTHRKIYKFLRGHVVVNSYSAKQALEFDREVEAERTTRIKDMTEADTQNIKISSSFINKDAIIDLDLNRIPEADKAETIQEIEYVAFLQNLDNTSANLFSQLLKIVEDKKTLLLVSKIFVLGKGTKLGNGKHILGKVDIVKPDAGMKKVNEEEISNMSEQFIVDIFANPSNWIEKFKSIDFDEMKRIINEDLIANEKPFTTIKQIEKMEKDLTITLPKKMSEKNVADKIVAQTQELRNTMTEQLDDKLDINIDNYVNKAKNDVIEKMFELFANMHYSKLTGEHFSATDMEVGVKSTVGYLPLEEQEEFTEDVTREIKKVLEGLNSPIDTNIVQKVVQLYVTSTFHTDEAANSIQQTWSEKITKKFLNIRNSVLNSDYDQLTEYYQHKYELKKEENGNGNNKGRNIS